MINLDWILVGIMVIIIGVQTYRGSKDMDLIFFEMIAFIVAAKLSLQWCDSIARMFLVSRAVVLIFFFVIFSIILILIAGVVAKYAQISLQPMDAYLSFIFGVITSWVILFVLLRMLLFAYPSGIGFRVPIIEKYLVIYQTLDKSEVAKQIVDFKAFKSVGNFFNELRLSQ